MDSTNNLVLVTWLDITHTEPDQDIHEAKAQEPAKCVTVGRLLELTDEKLVMAGTRIDDDQEHQTIYRCTTAIPRSVVIEIRHLKEDSDEATLAKT